MNFAFVANLDAELELEAPQTYQPSSRMRAASLERGRALAAQLTRALGAPIVTLVPGDSAPSAAARACAASLCWCPTPLALRALAQAGAPRCRAPSLATLQRVNHRAFAAELGPLLTGAAHVATPEQLEAHFAPPWPARGWLLKRAFGFSGRGRKLLASPAALDPAARTWLAASFAEHGGSLQVEPFVEVLRDAALHGHLTANGDVRVGAPTVQEIAADGSWRGTALAQPTDLTAREREALHATALRVAAALHEAGYFGPFGIDGYRWRAANGSVHFHPLSEINARLSMGWLIGMGEHASALIAD